MKIIHLDDHPLFSEGMHSLLRIYNPEANVLSSSDGRETLGLLDSEEDIDLILMDLEMPGITGFSMLEAIKQRNLSIPVIIISGTEDLFDIRSVMEAGAVGFIPKASKSQQLIEALKMVMKEHVVYLPEHIKLGISRLTKVEPSNDIDRLLAEYNISAKQFEVLKLMHKGYNNSEIADMQYVSVNTIKTHTSALFTALGVKDRLKCVIRAGSIGLLSGA